MLSFIRYLLIAVINAYRVLCIVSKKLRPKLYRREFDDLKFAMIAPQRPEGPFLPMLPISAPPAPKYSIHQLPKGHIKSKGFRSLECDTLVERNLNIPMRDGINLYADVYRPAEGNGRVPVILAWSPYGKHLNGHTMLKDLPERLGTRQDSESGYDNFEGPDPGFWVPRGYAVVNVDIRGSWHSEGDFYYWESRRNEMATMRLSIFRSARGAAEKLAWRGTLGWLFHRFWFVAAGSPPHLAAIAPWEGLTDAYRDQHRRGGISNHVMPTSLALLVPGKGLFEDAGAMALAHPLWDEYWEEKSPNLRNVKVPAYVVASYSSKIHSAGTFKGFRKISSSDKWLRVHASQEWPYFAKQQNDLARFFDYFLMAKQNDWPSTPRVRLSLLRFNAAPIVDRPLTTYPPPAVFRKIFLDASTRQIRPKNPMRASKSSYLSTAKDEIHFDMQFDEYTELIGYPSVNLNVQCLEHDDMDIFVMLRKLDRGGRVVRHINFATDMTADELPCTNVVQYNGPTGRLRVSHRAAKESDDLAPGEIFHPHDREEKVIPGSIVPIKIGFWPIGAVFEEGEGLRLSICGEDMCFPEMEGFPPETNENRGTHIVHTGGKHVSYLTLPFAKG